MTKDKLPWEENDYVAQEVHLLGKHDVDEAYERALDFYLQEYDIEDFSPKEFKRYLLSELGFEV